MGAASPPGNQEIDALVHGLIELVRENYVLPERVEPVESALLTGLEGGGYVAYPDLLELSKRITEDLREASGDLHFGIRPKPEAHPSAPPPGPGDRQSASVPENPPPVLGRDEILSGNVGYFEISAFPDPAIGGNWEGTGVIPHHEVPAPEALALALELARGGALPDPTH